MTDSSFKWYVAVLVVRARVGDEWADDCLIDHQVRLVRALDAESAYERALALGAASGQSYSNAEGALVTWEFCGLADLDEIQADTLVDGIEVYSWRTRGDAKAEVLSKEKLAAFWLAANGERTVEDLFD